MTPRPDPRIRQAVLDRIRSARSSEAPVLEVPRAYRTGLSPDVDPVGLFADRVSDYRATVRRTSVKGLPLAVRDAAAAHGARRIVKPPGIDPRWFTALGDLQVVDDEPRLTHRQLDRIDGVVSGCAIAIAETGTIVLDGGTGQGRRALSLLPDLLVCVVLHEQIVGDVTEALAGLDPSRPLTWISGPSATSDIELSRIEGVHGPRVLEVIIA